VVLVSTILVDACNRTPDEMNRLLLGIPGGGSKPGAVKLGPNGEIPPGTPVDRPGNQGIPIVPILPNGN
jgi:hypothetical protein